MRSVDPGNDGAFSMSQILKRTDEALASDWGDVREALRPSDHGCNGPGQCYWFANDKVLAVARCLDKMTYGSYMEMVDELTQIVTAYLEQEEEMDRALLLARTLSQWAKSKLSQ